MPARKVYHTEEERRAARLAAKKRYNDKVRGTSKRRSKEPTSWVRSAVKVAEQATKVEETKNGEADGPELPGVSLPGFEPPAGGEASNGGGDSDGSAGRSAPAGDSAASNGSAGGPVSGDNGEGAESKKKVDNKEVVQMLAGMYAGALKAGSDYAQKNDRMGLPDELIKINYDCMHLILTRQLATADIDSEEMAAYMCVGSSAWVGFNCFMAFKAKNPPKKSNVPQGVATDAATGETVPGPQREHVNGKPASEVASVALVSPGGQKVVGGVYK